jgi:hypothetical protein
LIWPNENAPGFDYSSFHRKSVCWLPFLFWAFGLSDTVALHSSLTRITKPLQCFISVSWGEPEKAEQAREKAERLRARVEDLYQQHRISEAAYRQGQAEYQRELAKYENQIAKYRSTTPGTGGTNE